VPGVELYAADIDPVAVRCAGRNLGPFGGRAFAGDLYAALPGDLAGRVDALLVNAPYVPTDEIAMMPPSRSRPSTAARTASRCTGGWPPARRAGWPAAGTC
jgi:methylase of polypeptide subunit release factors